MKKLKLLAGDYKVKKLERVEIKSMLRFVPSIESRELIGSSPPEIFVGRFGYPKVHIGPLIPPFKGRTEHLGMTEAWFGKSLEEIIGMRLQLLRGKKKLKVTQVDDRYARELREAMLSRFAVDMEARLRSITGGYLLSEDHQPFGPSALVEELKVEPGKTDHRIERAYYDRDLGAREAVIDLYMRGVPVSRIQQGLSAGLFGRERRFVPTRWSITAVDDMLSKYLLVKVREYPLINEFRLYYGEYLNNRWAIIMMPERWSYESIEVWFPGTLTEEVAIAGDYEPFEGRREYASMGGCYYAGRLAVAEKLHREGRQASVLILREAHPGYVPVGVWNVRETVRNVLKGRPLLYSELRECLEEVERKMTLPLRVWVENSVILRNHLIQASLEEFLR
ncbi:MAG: hypothetical protein J7L91_04805 [Candidatus Korarchaeota archaeon]|nr:hypothetical protein [Candidatus Korarchaeota archaeon]